MTDDAAELVFEILARVIESLAAIGAADAHDLRELLDIAKRYVRG